MSQGTILDSDDIVMNKIEKKFTLVALIVKQYWYSESEEEIKSLLKKVKVENEKVDLKLMDG